MQRKKEGFQGQKAIVIPRQILQTHCATNALIGHLYVTDIGYYPKAGSHYRSRPAGSNQHILIYCADGCGSLQVKEKIVAIEAGNFFVIPAHTIHSYQADEKKPWTIYWFHFTGTQAPAISDFLMDKIKGFTGQVMHEEKVTSLFDDMYQQLERGYSYDAFIYANMRLSHFFAALVYNEHTLLPGTAGNNRSEIDKVIDYLKKNIHEPLSLADMAAIVNLSPVYFSASFKKKTGFAPIEYFNHLKMQKACQYLLFTALRIKEIAQELGMEDQYYFSRLFTKVMGMSPNKYREKRVH